SPRKNGEREHSAVVIRSNLSMHSARLGSIFPIGPSASDAARRTLEISAPLLHHAIKPRL
ncbi:hypothetical protein, partial [Bradyrhizobium pachyrhizi]|uniref:hypothetical protein n=1 Tax=Bradyrhizobium pachyrhizi TaxID=280333 RepID=UPI001AEBC8DC